jgi:hypothetical protein
MNETSALVARYGAELVVTPADPLHPRTVIELDALPWVPYIGENGDPATARTLTKTLADPSSGNYVMVVKMLPGGPPARSHWHRSDTLYIVRQGELHIAGEGVFRVGSFRWVKGGFAYGPEVPGPDGVEFFFVSMGPYGLFFADEHRPPLGRWDEPGPPA